MNEPIPATSEPLSGEDRRKRSTVAKLLQEENKTIVDFAKHMVTVSFSAVGVVLTLKEKWLPAEGAGRSTLLLAVAIVLFLAAALLCSLAVRVYRFRVSPSDYAEVDEELHRIAVLRHRLTSAGMLLAIVATGCTAVVVLL